MKIQETAISNFRDQETLALLQKCFPEDYYCKESGDAQWIGCTWDDQDHPFTVTVEYYIDKSYQEISIGCQGYEGFCFSREYDTLKYDPLTPDLLNDWLSGTMEEASEAAFEHYQRCGA